MLVFFVVFFFLIYPNKTQTQELVSSGLLQDIVVANIMAVPPCEQRSGEANAVTNNKEAAGSIFLSSSPSFCS